MKILYVLPYLPVPSNAGNKSLTCGLLKYINQHAAFDVVLLTDQAAMTQSKAEELMKSEFPHVGQIKVFQKPFGLHRLFQRIRYLMMGYHPALGNYANSDMWSWIKQATKNKVYDVVHFDMFHTLIYLDAVTSTPCVLFATDAYSMAAATNRLHSTNLITSLSALVQELMFKRMEKFFYPRFDVVCSVSPVDADYLTQLTGIALIPTVGIAVADEYAERQILHFTTMLAEDENPRLLLTGSISYSVVARGVIDFLDRILPLVLYQYPSLRVTILGKDATFELRQCLSRHPQVEYLDFVKDYAEFLEQDWIYVYPQKCGSGLQTKVQQAMALGLPVVGYSVSFGGLQVVHGKHAYVCTSEEQLMDGLLELLSCRHVRIRMGKDASLHIRSKFSINIAGEQAMNVYRSLVK